MYYFLLRRLCDFSEFVGAETDDDFHETNHDLYGTHIPTTTFQKALLAVGSAVAGLADPWRADMVAVNGEVLGEFPTILSPSNISYFFKL